MPETADLIRNPEQLETLHLGEDLLFGVRCALEMGKEMVAGLDQPLDIDVKAADQTLVTRVDLSTAAFFNARVEAHYGGQAEVLGEEASLRPTKPITGRRIKWVVDSIDGTGEYAAKYWDLNNGEPINPKRPRPAGAKPREILPEERTSCTSIAMFEDDVLKIGIVYNPFRRQLIVSDTDLGGSFIIDLDASMGQDGELLGSAVFGHRLRLDDPASLKRLAGPDMSWVETLRKGAKPRTDDYSAVSQAISVLDGTRHGAMFIGQMTQWDTAAATKILLGAKAHVLNARTGSEITEENFLEQYQEGLVYADAVGLAIYLCALKTKKIEHLEALSRDANPPEIFTFAELWRLFGRLAADADGLVHYSQDEEGGENRDRIQLNAFGIGRLEILTRGDIRRYRRAVRKHLNIDRQTMPKWEYTISHLLEGIPAHSVKLENPDDILSIEGAREDLTVAEFTLKALRELIRHRIYQDTVRYAEDWRKKEAKRKIG